MSNINLCDCEENWMEIKNKNNSKYLLSSKGRLYSYSRKKFIGVENNRKYIYIGGNSGFFSTKIHRLVYRYFYQINIEDYDRNYNEVDHFDAKKNHNCVCNLRICSSLENNNNTITRKNKSEGQKGNKKSKETKQKIRKSLTGRKGKKHTEESIKKMRKPRKKYKCQYCSREIGGKGNLRRHEKVCNKN